jgi:hypothetical protein
VGAGYYFAQRDFDPTPIFGLDQVIVYLGGTIAAGIVGLAMGPVIGNMVFRASHSKTRPLMDMVTRKKFTRELSECKRYEALYDRLINMRFLFGRLDGQGVP